MGWGKGEVGIQGTTCDHLEGTTHTPSPQPPPRQPPLPHTHTATTIPTHTEHEVLQLYSPRHAPPHNRAHECTAPSPTQPLDMHTIGHGQGVHAALSAATR
jgi:hypothetical protein